MVRVADTLSSAKPKASGRRRGRIVFWVIFAVAAVCFIVSVLWFRSIARSYYQPSFAMENSIQPGDRMFVDTGLDVRHGDLVILSLPQSGTGALPYVRRVIGLQGDRVACCDASGRVTVNNKPLSESYVYPGDQPSIAPFSVTLGKGQIWVLGDHRSIAIDSRMWGPVPAADVVGRVAAISRGISLHFLSTPQTFITAGLAPPDGRTANFIWPVVLNLLATLALLILIVLGITRTVIRRRRQRRGTPPRPSLDAPTVFP
jgi:signal peptidase I